jgi:hypothetical protein
LGGGRRPIFRPTLFDRAEQSAPADQVFLALRSLYGILGKDFCVGLIIGKIPMHSENWMCIGTAGDRMIVVGLECELTDSGLAQADTSLEDYGYC